MTGSSNPTAIVTWAHREPDWDDEAENAWKLEVARFVNLLRDQGVDAIVDLHDQSTPGIDWTRYGEKHIRDRDWVLVLLSPAWRERYEGRNETDTGFGAVGEANAIRSAFHRDQASHEKLVLVTLPMQRDAGDLIPDGLHGPHRFTIKQVDDHGVQGLLRLLHGRPEFPPVPLGPIPDLPPAALDGSDEPASSSERDEASTLPVPMPLRRGALSDLLDAAPKTRGAPDRWFGYPDMLLFRFVARADGPSGLRARTARDELGAAAAETARVLAQSLRRGAALAPVKTLQSTWTTEGGGVWTAGSTTTNADTYARRSTQAVALAPKAGVLVADRTMPTRETEEGERWAWSASYEPVIAAELIAFCLFTSRVFSHAASCEIAVQLVAGDEPGTLVSAESYTGSGDPFGKPTTAVENPGGRHSAKWHSDACSATPATLGGNPGLVAETLLEDWLAAIGSWDVFDVIARHDRP